MSHIPIIKFLVNKYSMKSPKKDRINAYHTYKFVLCLNLKYPRISIYIHYVFSVLCE